MAALIAAGTFTLAASLAAGTETSQPAQIPDSAFQPISLPLPSRAVRAGQLPVGVPMPGTRMSALGPLGTLGLPPTPLRDRAKPVLPEPSPIVVPAATTTTKAAPKTTHSISGPASWYCRAGWSPCTVTHPDDGGIDAYAAAGPRLRAAIGSNWRGTIIWVDGLRVRLIDWCQCYQGESNEKLLDVYFDVFERVGSRVTVRW